MYNRHNLKVNRSYKSTNKTALGHYIIKYRAICTIVRETIDTEKSRASKLDGQVDSVNPTSSTKSWKLTLLNRALDGDIKIIEFSGDRKFVKNLLTL